MTVRDVLEVLVLAEYEAHQRPHLGLERDLLPGQPGGLGGRGQLDMEAPVDRGCAPRRPRPALNSPRDAPQLLQILGLRALGGEPGGGTRDGRPVVGEVAQFLGAPVGEPGTQPVLRRDRRAAVTKLPPPRPLRVVTRPCWRSAIRASRKVTVETPS